jgi:Flp pilus assembly pilin Flp
MNMNNLSLITRIRRRIKDRKGQSTTEYILILAIVVMLASKVNKGLSTLLTGKVDKLQSDISNFGDE